MRAGAIEANARHSRDAVRHGARPAPTAIRAASEPFPEEVPVAIEVDGFAYAVMMATPEDLEDFVIGFALAEGLIGSSGGPPADDVRDVAIHRTDLGMIVRIFLERDAKQIAHLRVRSRLSDGGCGLCGLERLEALDRPLPAPPSPFRPSRAAIARAIAELCDAQVRAEATRGLHAAALCTSGGTITACREDVGRHNALDKLVGHALRAGLARHGSFVLMTSRCSFELVEKTAIAGFGALVTLSTPTTLAIRRAQRAGLPVVSPAGRGLS